MQDKVDKNRISEAFERFDNYNKQDPNKLTWNGSVYPQEYFLSLKLHEWVLRLEPSPNEALLLASRCQHIGRWELERDKYPMDRDGYLKWRKQLALNHASTARKILEELAFDQSVIDEVEDIILKRKIKVNPLVQTMENALCLVFLEYLYEDFFPKHTDKIVNILMKSLLKMDKHGHDFALTIKYSPEGLGYIHEAIAKLSAK